MSNGPGAPGERGKTSKSKSKSKSSSSGSDSTMGYGGGYTGSGETHKPGYDTGSSPYGYTQPQYTTPSGSGNQGQQGGGGSTTTTTTTPTAPPPPPPPSYLIPAEGETEDQEYERLQKLLTYMDEGGGNPGNNISDWPGTPEAREKLELRVRKIELNRELKASETRIAEGEEGLRGKVTESRLARESAATQALESKLEEATEFGMQARQLVGEQQASRGLLRSTVTGERLGDVNLREAQFKEGAKLRTSAFVDEGKRQEDIMFTERDQIRELAKQNRLYAELDQTIASIEDISRFERQMAHEREIAGAQMSSQQSAGFASFLGSVVSTVLSVAFFL